MAGVQEEEIHQEDWKGRQEIGHEKAIWYKVHIFFLIFSPSWSLFVYDLGPNSSNKTGTEVMYSFLGTPLRHYFLSLWKAWVTWGVGSCFLFEVQ